MKRWTLCLTVALFAVVATAAYTPSDINYDAVSNPETLTQMLMDLFDNYQGTSVLFDPQTTAPATSEGKLYYNDTSDALYLYTGSAWELVDTEGGTNLDGAYNLGSAITVDGDAITLTTGAAVDNVVLALVGGETTNNNDSFTITHAGTGDAISINGASTGNLIYDEDGNFTVSSAGVMTFAGGSIPTADFLFNDTYDVGWDTSADTFYANDNAKFALGTNYDWVFSCDNTDGNLEAAAANDMFRFGETTNFDFAIHGGTNTNVVTFDTDDSALLCTFDGFDLVMNDDDKIKFGDSSEFVIEYDEDGDDDLVIVAATANDQVLIGDGTTGTDFVCVSSAGTTATHAAWFDASGNTNEGIWKYGNDDHGLDVEFYGETASQLVTWDQSADTWYFGDDAEGVDVYFNADTTGDLILWDESDESLELTGVSILLDDDSDLFIGTGKDFSVTSDTATELDILPVTTDETSVVNFGATTSGVDVRMWGATGAAVALFDASADAILLEQVDIALGDGDKILLGDTLGTGDFVISSTSAILTVAQVAANTGTMVFGASGTDVPITWNGETAGDYVQFNVDNVVVEDITVTMMDDTQLAFGDANDVTIEYDEDGTNQLEITGAVRVEGTLGYTLEVTTDINNRVLTSDESGGVFTNIGDTDGSIFTLPTAAAGLIFTFIDNEATAAEDVYILANTADKIAGGTAAEYYNCYDDTAFSYVTLLAIDAENWVVIAEGGTWAADDDTTE